MIKKKLVQEAVNILRNLNKKYYDDDSRKKPLLEGEEQGALFLQINLKKIPEKHRAIKMIKVLLPHSLIKDSDEVCLIMGDLDKKNHKAEIEPDILHYKQLLEEHGITCISEIVTLRQLRTDYKPYEAKQKLLAAYDVFLTDKKIAECLPRVLGKHFFKKRKFPIQINVKSSNLKQQIEKALSTKVFSVTGQGNTCCSEIAYLDMKDSEILENIKAVTETLSCNLPGLWDNVMGVYLKTSKSKAFPLYMSYDNSNKIQLKGEVEDSPVTDDLSTLPNVKVEVCSDGSIKTFYFKEEDENNEEDVKADTPESMKETEKAIKGKAEMNLVLSESEDFKNQNTSGIHSKEKTKEESSSPNCSSSMKSTEVTAPKSVKNIKSSKKTKRVLAVSENESESQTKDEIQNLEVTAPKSVRNIKSSNKAKKGLAVVEKESESQTKEEIQKKPTVEVNLKENEKREGLKRKRTESKTVADPVQTSVRAVKKRKVEGINMKTYNSRKESRKNNKKRSR